MRYHYVWLAWSGAFLLLWLGIYLANPGHRKVMWRTSLATALLGLIEPIYVPTYWNPPSLFELAQRTGFDRGARTGSKARRAPADVIVGIPLEELLFGFTFGMYWTGVYEHLAWTVTFPRLAEAARPPPADEERIGHWRMRG